MSKDYIEIGAENKSNNDEKNSFDNSKTFKFENNKNERNKDENNKNENSKLNFNPKNNFENNSKSNSKENIDDVKQGKWIVVLTLIVLAYFAYQPLTGAFMTYLHNNPSLYRVYLYIFSEINNNTISGLFMVSILGAVFFMILPSEAIFIYYLSSTYYSPILIIFLVVLGSLVGLSFNYFFGRLLGERVLKLIFRKNFEKYKNTIDKWGGTFVFLGNIFPGPMEVLSVFFGSFKYDYKKFMFLCAAGRIIKYIILFLAFTFFWDSITLYYENFINLL